jgi:hypothetical protein
MSSNQQEQPERVIACNLDAIAPDKREEHSVLTGELFSPAVVGEIRELDNGYAFRLPLETESLRRTVEFIANERLCCPFLSFTLVIGEQFWLELTGAPDVKDFIRAEFVAALQTEAGAAILTPEKPYTPYTTASV